MKDKLSCSVSATCRGVLVYKFDERNIYMSLCRSVWIRHSFIYDKQEVISKPSKILTFTSWITKPKIDTLTGIHTQINDRVNQYKDSENIFNNIERTPIYIFS